jgi:acyl-CoA synthetase (NDP forming)
MMAGLGGIHIELLKDVAFHLAPLDAVAAASLLSQLRVAPLFNGYRGAAPLARAPLIDLLIRLSELITDRDEIKEVDLNPVFVDGKGVMIADVRIIVNGHENQT